MDKKEILVLNPIELGLSIEKVEEIKAPFQPVANKVFEISPDIEKVISEKEITKEVCAKARELRLKSVKIRSESEIVKDDKKRGILNEGNAIQLCHNLIVAKCKKEEERLEAVEKHFENLEKQRIADLQKARETELTQYGVENVAQLKLGEMVDDVYNSFLETSKTRFQEKQRNDAAIKIIDSITAKKDIKTAVQEVEKIFEGIGTPQAIKDKIEAKEKEIDEKEKVVKLEKENKKLKEKNEKSVYDSCLVTFKSTIISFGSYEALLRYKDDVKKKHPEYVKDLEATFEMRLGELKIVKDAQDKADKDKKDADEKAKMEKTKKYKAWLKENGVEDSDTSDNFKIIKNEKEVVLYKKVSTYTL